jgi:hypothetical protein
VETLLKKYARYGPLDRYDAPPDAGMCISVFALVEKGDAVLVGVPKEVKRWRDDWLYSKRKEEGTEIFEEWRLPSCYLREGEDPRSALGRIVSEEIGARGHYMVSPENPMVFSYYSPSDSYPGSSHWDLALIYRVRLPKTISFANNKYASRFWKELEYLQRGSELGSKEFGWNTELMADLKLMIFRSKR